METKVCSKCKQEKSTSQFHREAKRGYQPYCKSCRAKVNAESNARHNPKRYVDSGLSIIYGVRSKIDKEICYVGESMTHLNIRMSNHKTDVYTNGSTTPFHQAIREQGWNNFEFFILDEETPWMTEDCFIQMFRPRYNVRSGNTERQVA